MAHHLHLICGTRKTMGTGRNNFDAIVREYSQPLYWHIRRLVVSHDDAEDVLQDTFVKAFRKLWTLRDRNAIKTWLYRIATNEACAFLRKRHTADGLSDALCAKLMDSEYVDYTKDGEIKLQKALLELSPLQRTVFCLKYYDEMDYDEIAKVTGSSEGSLRVSYHAAKEKVKQYINEEQ